MIIDGHVRLGRGREVALEADTLLATMDELGIDHALVCPGEYAIAYDNREGNRLATALAARAPNRVSPYAVANPWRGPAALEELRQAYDEGAVALALDPSLQGFDVLDGLAEPLIGFAAERGWLVYVRTGTPPTALPLPVASLARRFPETPFLMGKSGATDFWIDAAPALRYAANLYADTAYAPWDTVLSEFAADAAIGTARCVFTTDAPYTVPRAELARIIEWRTIDDSARADVLGANLQRLLGSRAPHGGAGDRRTTGNTTTTTAGEGAGR